MKNLPHNAIKVRTHALHSAFLNRSVSFDCMYPAQAAQAQQNPGGCINASLLLINDGQLLEEVGFTGLLGDFLCKMPATQPLFCVGIYAGKERILEYGVSSSADYLGRGANAPKYALFIMKELLPWLRATYNNFTFTQNYIAGFSLGGLSALDIASHHSTQFSGVGVFSGALWWRKVSVEDPDYNDSLHRLAHEQIRIAPAAPWMRYFFECGTEDESAARNTAGIIDSIQDTKDIIKELIKKGIPASNYQYLEIKGGKHDMKTWALAWPDFFAFMWQQKSVPNSSI